MRRKGNKNKYLILLLVIVIFITLFVVIIKNIKTFEIESRVEQLKQEKKKDDNIYKAIGWIRVQGTNIDMPIISIKGDNDFPVKKEKYSWTLNSNDKFYNSMRIYGHNIFNLSANPKKESNLFKRFEPLMAFVYYDFAKENQYIQLTMSNKEYVYKIFSVGMIDYEDISRLPIGEFSKKELDSEIKLLEKKSIYDYDISVDSNDKIISLITCTRMFGKENDAQIVVSGKLINSNKIMPITKVRKTKEYKKIENALKGDDSDENDEV